MKNEKKPVKLDIEYDHEFSDINTFDELIAHFQLLKSNYDEREDIINQTIEFYCGDGDEERIYMNVYTTRLATEEEQRIMKQSEEENIRFEKSELDELKNLMDKYPKEVLNWVMKKPEK